MKDIYHSAELLFYFLKSLGLAPYQVDKKSKCFKMSYGNYLQLFAAVLFWAFVIFLQLFNLNDDERDTGIRSNLLTRIWEYQYTLQNFLTIFIIAFSYWKRKNVENFFKLISDFDQTVQKLNWKFKVTQFRFLILIIYVTSAIMIILYMCAASLRFRFLGNIKTNPIIILLITCQYVAITEFYWMLSLQFILSSYCIQERLTAMITNLG